MAKNEKTPKKVASKASKLLIDTKSSKDVKSVSGSAGTRAGDKKRTSKGKLKGSGSKSNTGKSKSSKDAKILDLGGTTRAKKK